ncbi:NUDIX hydrolase [Microbacterium plantarum]|uniref:NUDIX hydrolase n=1 Tax=Microbacterium plantarum TaxID=1816425 RepID=A0ABV5EPD1_9MICO
MTIIDRTASYAKQFTVSGYVLNPAEDRILLIHHKKLAKWLPPGGHVDEDETPQAAVVREVFEETGVAAELRPHAGVDLAADGRTEAQLDLPISMSYQLIPQRPGEPAHIHMDMAFVLHTSERGALTPAAGEVHDAGWFSSIEIDELDAFPSVKVIARELLAPAAAEGRAGSVSPGASPAGPDAVLGEGTSPGRG